MDNVKQFLKAIKVSQDVIEALAEGKDIDVQAAAKTYEDDRTDVLRAKIEPEILDTVKKEEGQKALATVEGVLKGKLKKTFGLAIPNVRDLSMDEFLEKAQSEIEETKRGGDETLKKQLADITERYNVAEENLIGLKTQLKEKEERIEMVRKEVEDKYARNRVLASALDKVKWAFDDPARIEREKRLVAKEIEEQFQVGPDGTLRNLDGSVVVKPNDSGIYKNVDEWVSDYTTQYKLVKQSDPRRTDIEVEGPTARNVEAAAYLDQFAKELG